MEKKPPIGKKQIAKRINGKIERSIWKKDLRQLFICLGITVIIPGIVFSPTLHNGFINWDDGEYVVNNLDIKELTLNNIVRVFSSSYASNYQPLTMITYMVEFKLFKLNPLGYHFTNYLLHIVNCLIVFALIYSLSRKYLISLIVVLLFAIHPLRVESVAWVAERKDLLSALFYFLSLLSYIRYLRIQDQKLYYLSIFSFLLSLLSKPMAVSQPFVLLLIYYFKNGKPGKKAVVDAIPFFIISALFAILTLFTQNVLMPIGTDDFSLSTIHRIFIPFYGIIFYIVKSILPINLSAFYPFPDETDHTMTVMLIASSLIVVIIAAAIYHLRLRSRPILFGSLFYFFTLLPVLQIIPVGYAMVAERYTYIPFIGIYFIFASFCDYLFEKKFMIIKA